MNTTISLTLPETFAERTTRILRRLKKLASARLMEARETDPDLRTGPDYYDDGIICGETDEELDERHAAAYAAYDALETWTEIVKEVVRNRA